jgi:hypothetical protein
MKAVIIPIQHHSSSMITFPLQMYGLMNEVSDNFNKRLLEYADKQEIFDIKEYVNVF